MWVVIDWANRWPEDGWERIVGPFESQEAAEQYLETVSCGEVEELVSPELPIPAFLRRGTD